MKEVLNLNKVMANLEKEVNNQVEFGIKGALVKIANTAVSVSPVHTGAYVTSFSFNVGAGRPRGKSSNDPTARRRDKASARGEGLDNLMSDINRIQDFNANNTITLRNGSPHAVNVEYGEGWSSTSGYLVFGKIRNIYG
tara:strand:- start:2741 stop:3157 length:417 start_codon:yes stop_codon:yes gene_type:complete